MGKGRVWLLDMLWCRGGKGKGVAAGYVVVQR